MRARANPVRARTLTETDGLRINDPRLPHEADFARWRRAGHVTIDTGGFVRLTAEGAERARRCCGSCRYWKSMWRMNGGKCQRPVSATTLPVDYTHAEYACGEWSASHV